MSPPTPSPLPPRIYFTDVFNVTPEVLSTYGAFNVACSLDLPLFIDPFLLFTSKKEEYRQLHADMINYLRFLRDKASGGDVDPGLLRAWYCFPEVRQNMLGFCMTGNSGRGLGMDFARILSTSLHGLFSDFGSESITAGSHLEKLSLIRSGVGRDCISDFTTNLIKGFLLSFTQTFAQKHIEGRLLKKVKVPRVAFDYTIGCWTDGMFELPWLNDDYIILTPVDILTKDDTWINKEDFHRDLPEIRESIPNESLRSQINAYFASILPPEPTKRDEKVAMSKTLAKFPQLIDYFIKKKEDTGEQAVAISAQKVEEVRNFFINSIVKLAALLQENHGRFYSVPANTLEEVAEKIVYLKHVIEDQDGYRIFYEKGKKIEREKDLQILFKLVWGGSVSSVDAEVNNGRGPVDFKVSRGSKDTTLVEFKLASNSKLKQNLENQVEVYKKANNTLQSYKVILFFTEHEANFLIELLNEVKATKAEGIVLIDARSDNKPSGSKA